MILKRGILLLIEVIESHIFESTKQILNVIVGRRVAKRAMLLPPLSDELVSSQIWPRLHRRVNISLLWRLHQMNCLWKENVSTTLK